MPRDDAGGLAFLALWALMALLVWCGVWPVAGSAERDTRRQPPSLPNPALPHLPPHARRLQDPAVTRRVLDYMLFMNSKVLFKHLRHDAGQYQSHVPVSVHVNYHPGGVGWSGVGWSGVESEELSGGAWWVGGVGGG